VLSATFNNISVISWRSVLLVGETAENHDLPQVTDILYHIMLYRVELATLFVIYTDYIDSCYLSSDNVTSVKHPTQKKTPVKIKYHH
jgi:hypothetical protein